ncbi:MAG: alpha/beta hydrolase-fold protein [Bacteroidales bacterium]
MNKLRLTVVILWQVSSICLMGQTPGHPYKTFYEFRKDLERISNITEPSDRVSLTDQLWQKLKSRNQIPYRLGDSVAFLYKGEAKSVSWAGDFNGWKPTDPEFTGNRLGQNNIWISIHKFPVDARLDYKIVVDDRWILDPENPYLQMSGMGPNSEMHMPGWKFPDETQLAPDVIRGELTGNIRIISKELGYGVNYRVYTPYNYARCESLPVMYVTDGQDYADDEKGALVIILDNLIYSGQIKPVIAVFIDPREPGNDNNNRRMKEYSCNQKFADFIGDELVLLIDKSYKTHDCPDDRMILGTSLGGIASAWLGAVRINNFHLLGINSPAFNKTVLDRFAKLDWFPFRIYMTTGVYYDTQKQALEMKKILDDNKVGYIYREMNEGHSWGQWRALLGDMLRFFFPA